MDRLDGGLSVLGNGATRRPAGQDVVGGDVAHAAIVCPNGAQVKRDNMEIDQKQSKRAQTHKIREGEDMRHPEMTPEKIARRLVVIRTAFGLDPMQMADALDMHRPSWSRFENAVRAIPLEKAWLVVKKFGVTLDYIYLGETVKLDYETRARILDAESRLSKPPDEA
jgi:hypothetical protein